MQNPNLRCHSFSNSFQSLPTEVGVGRVRKKTSKCTLKRQREREKERNRKEREAQEKFPVEAVTPNWSIKVVWGFFCIR